MSDTENSIKKEFELFSNLKCSIVFFISSQKLNKKIHLIKEFFPDRDILISREITKIHESFYRGKGLEIDNLNIIPKGEVTVIISEKKFFNKEDLNESDRKKIKTLSTNKSIKDIVRIISNEKNISKSKIYNYCLKIKNEK